MELFVCQENALSTIHLIQISVHLRRIASEIYLFFQVSYIHIFYIALA